MIDEKTKRQRPDSQLPLACLLWRRILATGRCVYSCGCMDEEVYSPRGCNIRQYRIHRRFGSQEKSRRNKDKYIQNEDHVAHSQEGAVAADDQCRDLRPVEDRTTAYRQSDAGADEKPAKDGCQQFIWCDVRKMDQEQAESETANGESTADRKPRSDLAICECDERQVDHRYKDGERKSQNVGNQHRDTRDPAVDKPAGHEESL